MAEACGVRRQPCAQHAVGGYRRGTHSFANAADHSLSFYLGITSILSPFGRHFLELQAFRSQPERSNRALGRPLRLPPASAAAHAPPLGRPCGHAGRRDMSLRGCSQSGEGKRSAVAHCKRGGWGSAHLAPPTHTCPRPAGAAARACGPPCCSCVVRPAQVPAPPTASEQRQRRCQLGARSCCQAAW